MPRMSSVYSAVPWIAGATLIFLGALALPPPVGLSHAGEAVLGVVLAGVVLWVSEALPLGLTALVVLVLLGIVPTWKQAATFTGFASPVVFFLIGAAAIGTAVEASGLAERIARLLVRGARGSSNRLYLQMLASLPGLALLIPSAITRNAVLIPAYRDTLRAMGINQAGRTGRAIMLALGILNPLASSAILTGGVTSITASAIIGGFSWFRWFALMAVPYYVLICLGGVALRLITGKFEKCDIGESKPILVAPLSIREIKTVAVLVVVSALWLTDFLHGLSPAIPALLGAILLTCPGIGVLRWRDFESRLSWGLVLTVGASLSLAQAMVSTGAADWLGQQFVAALAGAPHTPLLVVISIVIAVAVVHIAITNLAACAALMIPVALTVAHTVGLNPIICALIVTIVIDSVIFYPVQTASNLLAYESGYFGAADVSRLGLTMLALTVLVSICVAVPYWSLLGLPLLIH